MTLSGESLGGPWGTRGKKLISFRTSGHISIRWGNCSCGAVENHTILYTRTIVKIYFVSKSMMSFINTFHEDGYLNYIWLGLGLGIGRRYPNPILLPEHTTGIERWTSCSCMEFQNGPPMY